MLCYVVVVLVVVTQANLNNSFEVITRKALSTCWQIELPVHHKPFVTLPRFYFTSTTRPPSHFAKTNYPTTTRYDVQLFRVNSTTDDQLISQLTLIRKQ